MEGKADLVPWIAISTQRASSRTVTPLASVRLRLRHTRPIVVAISAPTALALRTSEAAGITLAAIARDDGFELFTHPRRVDLAVAGHVA